MKSAYNLIHALAATTILVAAVLSNGFANFWRQFVYGLNQVMTPEVLKQNLLVSTALFGVLLLVLWASATFIPRRRTTDAEVGPSTGGSRSVATATVPPRSSATERFRAMRFAALATLVLAPVALGLNWLGAHAIEWITHVKPADQELVKCFTDGHYSPVLRVLLILVVLFQAPLLEEALFRGIIFRGFSRTLTLTWAIALSGFVFAFVHVNAASFVALWFLGAAFAWLYQRTGTILAPMTAHLLFNATNLVLLFCFPEIAAS